MKAQFFVLKDGQEPGLYPGIGIVEVGVQYPVQGAEHHALIKVDSRFKFVSEAPVEERPKVASKSAKEGTE